MAEMRNTGKDTMVIEESSQPIADGKKMHELVSELFPIHRSITGSGVRETLRLLQREIPLSIHEVATGTNVFDWQVPREWKIREAFIKDANGNRILDVADSTLHVVNYSQPVQENLSWSDLKEHIETLPAQPDLIPYRTSYFQERWGFCMAHRQFEELDRHPDAMFEVCIDTELIDGSLSYGELFLEGERADEVLITTHVCHPSLANDNLSGIAVSTYLAQHLMQMDRSFSYRFIFIPATIGAISWLSLNKNNLHHVKYGLILALLGDAGSVTYKRSRSGKNAIDRIASYVLAQSGERHEIRDFEPFGYDERQFCSPGINLPMGCLMRTPNGEFPEYHTSGDNLDFVKPQYLADSLQKCKEMIGIIENDSHYHNLFPYCEPRLGPRGLYHAFGVRPDKQAFQKAIQWVLNLSDGDHSLLDIAERSGMPFNLVREAAETLSQHKLLAKTASAVATNQ